MFFFSIALMLNVAFGDKIDKNPEESFCADLLVYTHPFHHLNPPIDFNPYRIPKIEIVDNDQTARWVDFKSNAPEAIKQLDYTQNLNDLKKVIDYSNQQFLRRGWSKKFLDERWRLAVDYAKQSRFYYTEQNEAITGTLGVTSAVAEQKLPMETYGWKLDRPKTKAGKTLIIEMRTYSMDPDAKRAPYKILWTKMNNAIQTDFRHYPELWDQDVVFTYGDDVSVKMYTAMGFVKANPKKYPPVPYYNEVDKKWKQWEVLVSSPKKMLAEFLAKMKLDESSHLIFHGYRSPVIFVNQHGQKLVADPICGIHFYGLISPRFLCLNERVELLPGMWIERAARVWFYPSGHVKGIFLRDQSLEIAGITIRKDSYVGFHLNGKLRVITTPGEESLLYDETGKFTHKEKDGPFWGG